MNKLKIVYLDFDDIRNPLLGAGQAMATIEVGKRLARKGHEVVSLCSKYPGSKNRTEEGITYTHIGLGSRFLRLNNLVYILCVQFYVMRLKADVIIECFTAPISTLFTPLFTRIPVLGLPSMFNAIEFSKKYHIPFHLIEKLGMKFYKHMVAYSDVDSKKMSILNKNIIFRIIPQGVDEKYLHIRHEKPKHILFLGRLETHQKGIDMLLKSYAKIASIIGYPLVIAGHGPDEMKLKSLVARLQLAKKVRFVGSTYGKKKEKLISEAIYVVFPSRHDEMSLWVLEALAGGMPIISFDLPEGKWIPNRTGLKAKPFDLDEYAHLLVKGTGSSVNKNMRKKARAFAKDYTWEHVADLFEDYIIDIVDENRYALRHIKTPFIKSILSNI